jgi:thioredoxin-like negative regulator of GroEL
MKELNKKELDGLIFFNKSVTALYFYSPLCGTCKWASKMLDVTLEALQYKNVYKCDINLMPGVASTWQIESVPCLVIMKGRQIVERVYAFKSAAHLYTILQGLQDS